MVDGIANPATYTGRVMIEQTDVPSNWRVVGELPVAESEMLERLTIGDLSEMEDEHGVTHVTWCEIEHSDGQRAVLRIAPLTPHTYGPVTLRASVVVAAEHSGLQRQELSSVPLGSITRAINARVAKDNARLLEAWRQMKDHLDSQRPRYSDTDEFYQAVANRWLSAFHRDEPSPTDRVASAWKVSKSSAQRWVAEARRRGFIPAGLTGKPGRRKRSSPSAP